MLKINLTIIFDPELRTLLHPQQRSCPILKYAFFRRTSIKDLIESLRVPHTEIGALIVNDRSVDFSYQPQDHDIIRVLSHFPPIDPCRWHLLRPTPLAVLSFLVDVNVAKLGTLLRMAGLDCIYYPELDDSELAEKASQEGRILLSRDRNLLKRKNVTHGHLVRSHLPHRQLAEILRLYGLRDAILPFSRCMECNTILLPVVKEIILHRLEPLTRKFYDTFFICRGCDRIYWPGSHKSGMEEFINEVISHLDSE